MAYAHHEHPIREQRFPATAAFMRDMKNNFKLHLPAVTLSRGRWFIFVHIRNSQLRAQGQPTLLGKIQLGNATWQRPAKLPELTNDERREFWWNITLFESNPVDALFVLGRESEQCCMCGQELTDPASKKLGMGPICHGKLIAGAYRHDHSPRTTVHGPRST